MGSWGTAPFQNDAAMDMVDGPIADDPQGDVWRAALVGSDTPYAEIVAACAVVAAALDPVPSPYLPERLIDWLASYGSVFGPNDVRLALAAIEHVTDPSYRPPSRVVPVAIDRRHLDAIKERLRYALAPSPAG